MLAYQQYPATASHRPWLVWLHGLLGSGNDWQQVLPYMADWPCLTVDLPGHSGSQSIAVSDFENVSSELTQLLDKLHIQDYILIGYSLGGRIAMYHACYGERRGLAGLVIEGGNPGLQSDAERQLRILNDDRWAGQFRQRPMVEVLELWYRQPVFSSLKPIERAALIDYRKDNDGATVADILQATSLGRQPWLGDKLTALTKNSTIRFCYLCGEYDQKFQQIARDYHLPLRIIAEAGHNAHRDNPDEFAQQLISFLKEC